MIRFAEGKKEEIIKEKKYISKHFIMAKPRLIGKKTMAGYDMLLQKGIKTIAGCDPLPQISKKAITGHKLFLLIKDEILPQAENASLKEMLEEKIDFPRGPKIMIFAGPAATNRLPIIPNMAELKEERFEKPKREHPACDCCGESRSGLDIRFIEDRAVKICPECLKRWKEYGSGRSLLSIDEKERIYA